jgi:hypothetical protein
MRIENSWIAGQPREGAPRVSRSRRVSAWFARALLMLPVIEGQL